MAVTDTSFPSLAGGRLVISVHFMPSQCNTSALLGMLSCADRDMYVPTAQISLGALAATPYSSLIYLPGLGMGTVLHCLPSQCSMTLWIVGSVIRSPTAHTSELESPTIPCSTTPLILCWPGLSIT